MSSAVFLIVAGILIGPIESKPTLEAISSCPSLCSYPAEARETAEQTCERAMKDIGAYMVGSTPKGVPPNPPGLTWQSLNPGNPVLGKTGDWVVVPTVGNAVPALCFPAPTGMK